MSGFRMDELPPIVGPRSERPGAVNEGSLPPRMRRWNWGAWFFGWIWAVAHRVPLGWVLFILMVPFSALYLGMRGNHIAWKYRRFSGPEEFYWTEVAWGRAGIAAIALSLVLVVLRMLLG